MDLLVFIVIVLSGVFNQGGPDTLIIIIIIYFYWNKMCIQKSA